MPTMSSFDRSRNAVPARSSISPPKTRCGSCFLALVSVIVECSRDGARWRPGPSGSSARHGLDKPRMQPGGRGEELAMDRLGPVVARPRAREGREPAAGFGEDDVGGSKIPIAGVRRHEAEIDRALGDAHEAQ